MVSTSDKVLYNLSSFMLDEEGERNLSKGFNFAVVTKLISVENIICNVQAAIEQISR